MLDDTQIIFKKLEEIQSKLASVKQTWFDVSGLSRYLGISQSTIRRLISSDSIPFRRVGGECGKILFFRSQIDLWVLTGEKNPGKRDRLRFQDLL